MLYCYIHGSVAWTNAWTPLLSRVSNVVGPTILFSIVSTKLFSIDEANKVVHDCWKQENIVLIEEQPCLTVIMREQHCRTNNIAQHCFNKIVQHWWSKQSCSWLLETGKYCIDRRTTVSHCYHAWATLSNQQYCSALFQQNCSALMEHTMLFMAVGNRKKLYS